MVCSLLDNILVYYIGRIHLELLKFKNSKLKTYGTFTFNSNDFKIVHLIEQIDIYSNRTNQAL